MSEPKNGRNLGQWIAIVLTAGSALVSVAWTYGQTTTKVEQIERRQNEDRQTTKETVQEVKSDVKQIGTDVQIILQKLTAMEAEQRAERRTRERR